MKTNKMKSIFFIALLVLPFLVTNAQSQTEDYYIGKWDLLIYGLPNGDTHMMLSIEKLDGQYSAKLMNNVKTKSEVKIEKLEIDSKALTVYWSDQGTGVNVYITMRKKDQNNVIGSLMDMFDMTGNRIMSDNANANEPTK